MLLFVCADYDLAFKIVPETIEHMRKKYRSQYEKYEKQTPCVFFPGVCWPLHVVGLVSLGTTLRDVLGFDSDGLKVEAYQVILWLGCGFVIGAVVLLQNRSRRR